MFNHSCEPNCYITPGPDGTMALKTNRSVIKGEELTISCIFMTTFTLYGKFSLDLWLILIYCCQNIKMLSIGADTFLSYIAFYVHALSVVRNHKNELIN